MTILCSDPVPQKAKSASSNKENPPCYSLGCESLQFFGDFPSSLSSSFLWGSDSIRSSLVSFSCCTTRGIVKSSLCRSTSRFSLRVSELPFGLLICLLKSTNIINNSPVKYTDAQLPVEDAHTWQCTPDAWIVWLCDWMCEHTFVLWKFTTWRYIYRELSVVHL